MKLKVLPVITWRVQPGMLQSIVILLHCMLAAVQCIVISPVCLFVAGWVCLWVCYHDNSKLCASILTKLGL